MNSLINTLSLSRLVIEAQSGFASGESVEDGVLQVRMNNISKEGHWDWSKTRRVPGDESTLEKYGLSKGDLLFNNTNSPELVGRTIVFHGSSEPVVFSNHFTRLRLRTDRALPDYVARWLFLQWRAGKIGLLANQWVNQAAIRADSLLSLELPLPPLEEQRRIAAILDKADAIRRKRQEAIALTEQLLRSTFLEMFGDIPARRSPWEWGSARTSVEMSSGKSPKDVLVTEPTEFPVYGGNGINGWAKEPLYREPIVVVGRVGQQCGVVHMVEQPCWVTDNAIVIRVTKPDVLDPVYLGESLHRSPIRDIVDRLDLPFINQEMLRDQPIPLPPIAIQRKFAALRRRVLCTRSTHMRSYEEANALFHSLTHRAFTGQL